MKPIINTILLATLLLSGCVWGAADRPVDREVEKLDRNVYAELTLDDLISVMVAIWPRKVSDYCLQAASKIAVVYSDDLKRDCEEAYPCDACIFVLDLKIVIPENAALLDQYEAIEHELTHFFGHCVDKDADGDHTKFEYWVLNDPENSIEAQACKEVWKATRSDLH